MKIFIAGARSIKGLDASVQRKMLSIYQKGYDVLVGDCYGVDASVQRFYAKLGYDKVFVYASNGKARNNIGHWSIRKVPVADNIRGFDFYAQKDIAMANEADGGFMIWDGESRGTLNNAINLVAQNKTVLLYLAGKDKMAVIKTIDDLNRLIGLCVPKTKVVYSQLLRHSAFRADPPLFHVL